jgi:hypothetical protein
MPALSRSVGILAREFGGNPPANFEWSIRLLGRRAGFGAVLSV